MILYNKLSQQKNPNSKFQVHMCEHGMSVLFFRNIIPVTLPPHHCPLSGRREFRNISGSLDSQVQLCAAAPLFTPTAAQPTAKTGAAVECAAPGWASSLPIRVRCAGAESSRAPLVRWTPKQHPRVSPFLSLSAVGAQSAHKHLCFTRFPRTRVLSSTSVSVLLRRSLRPRRQRT